MYCDRQTYEFSNGGPIYNSLLLLYTLRKTTPYDITCFRGKKTNFLTILMVKRGKIMKLKLVVKSILGSTELKLICISTL